MRDEVIYQQDCNYPPLMVLMSLGTAGWSVPIKADDTPNYPVYIPAVWTSITATWQHNGREGGTVTSLVTVPSQPGVIYAGSWGSGVYKSLDGGTTWNLANFGLTNGFVYSLAVDPTNPNILYAGTFYGGVFNSV